MAAAATRCCLTLAVVLVSSGGLPAQEVLPDSARTNGTASLKAVNAVKELALQSAVQIGSSREKAITGIVVSPDGYLLTLASEAEAVKPFRAFLSDGSGIEVREVKRDDALNLMLLKVDRLGFMPVAWGESLSLDIGHWVVSPTDKGKDVRLGVMSANRRSIPNSGAVLGVRFGIDDAATGVTVEEVAKDSPADQGGLEKNDVILSVDGQNVTRNEAVARIISTRRPGDVVKVRYRRAGLDKESEVRLASKSRVLTNWAGEDFGNHGTSLRTDNFSEVIQHDLPLDPADMGGAVFDLHGRAIAINVARVDRVTNYALPVEVFLPDLLKWLREDRVKEKRKEK
ncbi:MAG: S1C family serine protease [Verrucomicrobium sp.]|nr:PDZ domain-containing protein [Verrucomicrobium sp.]